jgi:aminobenzoyl-glutamate utilization protein B
MPRKIWDIVDARQGPFCNLADRVWETPELLYNEFRSAEAHRETLEREGFRIGTDLAGIPTALSGEAGEDGPVIAILGEYDALPGLSQEAGVAEPRPAVAGGAGHGCGHNLLGAASLLAATAVKEYLARHGLAGRVRYYGCPAEEGGAAKAFMVRAGCFCDVDIAITWHPAAFNQVAPAISLANTRIDFHFKGRSAHASAQPHLGRSALDAVELMNVGANYLREHMPFGARLHYAILDTGGIAPNVVQASAKVRYAVRTSERAEMAGLLERVIRVAEGAALMTGTSVETRVLSSFSNLIGNAPLEEAMEASFQRLGPVAFDETDQAFARAIQKTVSADDIASAYATIGLPREPDKVLCDTVVPREVEGKPMLGSTDVGDVSWVVPTVQAHVATYAIGTPGHSWQLTSQGKVPAAHKALVHVAKVMAATALEAIHEPQLVARAKADLAARTAGQPYVSPIPDDVEPPLHMGRPAG